MLTLQLRACCFDFYDTLVAFREGAHAARTARMAALCGAEPKPFGDAWRALVVPSNLGRYPRTEDRVRAVLELLGVRASEAVVDAIREEEHRFLREETRAFDDVPEALRWLRTQALTTALVTNASPSVREALRGAGLESSFDAVVISSEVGSRKPDPAIYAAALRALSVGPEEALFVGDGNDRELEGAKVIGMATVLVRRGNQRAVVMEQSERHAIDYEIASLAELPSLIRGHARDA